jgi:Tfp pilus assembly PilM family ATPase
MKRRIIGLEISGRTIKLAEFRKGLLSGIWLTNLIQKEIEGDDPKSRANWIREFLKKNVPRGAEVISSIPLHKAMMREIALPFTDIKKIDQVIRYEIEPHLPLPIEEVVIDYYIKDVAPQKSELMVFAIPRTILQEHTDLLKDAGIRPKIIDIDSLALFNIYRKTHQEDKGPTALIDIGSEWTLINIVTNGILSFTRALQIGRDDLISRPDEGSGSKHQSLDSLIQEIRYTINSFEAQSKLRPQKILLGGEGMRLRGIMKSLKSGLGIETSLIIQPKDSPPLSQATPLMAVAMGLALRGVEEKSPGLNLLKKLSGDRKRRFTEGWIPLSVAATLIILPALGLHLNVWLLERRYQSLKAEIREVFTSTLPEVNKIVNEVHQMEVALKRMGYAPGVARLELLRELSLRSPQEKTFALNEVLMRGETIEIKGSTDSFGSLTRFKKELTDSPYFDKVEITSSQRSGGEKKIGFSLRMIIGRNR